MLVLNVYVKVAVVKKMLVDSVLHNYIAKVNNFPVLEEEREKILLERWCKQHCISSVQELIAAHLRLVVSIAQGFRFYGIPMMDLIQEGNFGLMTAAKKFKMEKKCRFSTYSMLWIKASIQNFILNSWALVKVNTTNAKRKLFFGLRKVLKSLEKNGEKGNFFENTKAVAQEMNMPVEDVKDVYNVSMQNPTFLSDSCTNSENGSQIELSEQISDCDTNNQENLLIAFDAQKKQKQILLESLETLSAREKEIFLQRNSTKKITLEDLSKKFQISKERVRQIEKSVLKKLRSFCQGRFFL